MNVDSMAAARIRLKEVIHRFASSGPELRTHCQLTPL
jgi:hypothetical protein